MNDPRWTQTNRAHWDEMVKVHLNGAYDLTDLRAWRGSLNAIEEMELWPVEGKRVLHLQCHFGRDSLILAQRGATIVGLDFSAPAILAADDLARELGLADRARFVQADLYEAPKAIPEPASFDMVFVTWGAITWLPDIRRWAEIVAFFLKPGGSLYLAEGHPAAFVFDDAAPLPDGRPGFFAPYFSRAGDDRCDARLCRRNESDRERSNGDLDPPLGRDRLEPARGRPFPRLAARARGRHLEDV
jgi:SAM-dependent methyltransferase